MKSDERLEDAEMVEILEDLARNSRSATAQIQAIKQLRIMRGEQADEPKGGFEGLYEVGKPAKTRRAA